MQPSISRRSLPILLVIAGIMVMQVTSIWAKHPNYVLTPGLDKVKAAVERLDREKGEVGRETRQALLIEGRACLALEQQYYEGKMPIIIEAQEADAKALSLQKEVDDIEKRIRNFNGTQEEADRLNRERDELNARVNALNAYIEELNARIEADTKKLVERYAAFVRNADTFLVSVVDASAVKAAMAKGEKPPFQPTWNVHRHNREVAKGLVLKDYTCALVVSLTLDLKPRPGEKSLKDVANVIPEVKGADIANRYVRADELAERLWDELKRKPQEFKPQESTGPVAEEALLNRKGIIYFENGYLNERKTHRISHIDLWDGSSQQLGDWPLNPAFKESTKIWFWELPD